MFKTEMLSNIYAIYSFIIKIFTLKITILFLQQYEYLYLSYLLLYYLLSFLNKALTVYLNFIPNLNM